MVQKTHRSKHLYTQPNSRWSMRRQTYTHQIDLDVQALLVSRPIFIEANFHLDIFVAPMDTWICWIRSRSCARVYLSGLWMRRFAKLSPES